jgi:hypothetical protein
MEGDDEDWNVVAVGGVLLARCAHASWVETALLADESLPIASCNGGSQAF